MAKAVRWFGVLVIAASLTAGCGKDGDKGGGSGTKASGGGGGSAGGAVAKAKTPKEAVANMSKALQSLNKDQFLAAAYLGDGGKELGEAMFGVVSAMMSFGKDMEKAYGKDAGGETLKDAPIFTDEELAKLEIKEEGDKASTKNPKDGKPMPLIKKDGVWLVDITEGMPPAAERAKFLKQSKAMVDGINKVRAKIGAAGMTKEKLNEELMGAMMAASMADANAPT